VTTQSVLLGVLRDLEIKTDGVGDETRLREDLEVDSTELIEIAVAIEQRTSAAIDTNDILALKTFGELVTYVDHAPSRG